MVVTNAETEKVVETLETCDGKHTNYALNQLQKEFACGPTRAGNLLRHAVKNGYAEIQGLRIRLGGHGR